MKKLLLSLFVCTGIAFGAYAITTHQTAKVENYECQYGQCTKYKADGTRCKNCCQQYSNYCWSHNQPK